MAAVDPLGDLQATISLCGFTVAMRNRLITNEGWTSLEDVSFFTGSDVANIAKQNASRPTASRIFITMVQQNKLKALFYWAKRRRQEGADYDITELDAARINELMDERALDEDEKDGTDKLFPPKFDPKDFESYKLQVENYLDSQRGVTNVPLSYIIRPDNVNPDDATNEHQRLVWSAPLLGAQFNKDNREVYRVLKQTVIGSDGFPWFDEVGDGDGRAGMQALIEHYEGTAEQSKARAFARAKLEALFYKNENALPFEMYVTRHKRYWKIRKDNGEASTEEFVLVEDLLKRIQSQHPQVLAAITLCRASFRNDYTGACREMSTQISEIFPGRSEQGRKRSIGNVASDHSRGGRGRGRGSGRGGRGGGRGRGSCILSGIDVSDPTREFTQEEWQTLRENNHVRTVIDMRNRTNFGGRGRGRGRGGRGRGGRGQRDRHIRAVHFEDSEEKDKEPESSAKGGQNGTGFGSGRYGSRRSIDSSSDTASS